MAAALALGLLGSDPAARRLATAAELVATQVGVRTVSVPLRKGVAARLMCPESADKLVDLYVDRAEEVGGLTPYYGIVWPAASTLASVIDSYVRPGDRVVELGAGLGLCGIACGLLASPGRVLLTDHDQAAVTLSRGSAAASGVRHLVDAKVLDWTALETWPEASFDTALAADVIYELSACAHIAAVADWVLAAESGRLVIADQLHRPHREALKDAMRDRGFNLKGERHVEAIVAPPEAARSDGGQGSTADSNGVAETGVVITVFSR